jgi:hypothetical protein
MQRKNIMLDFVEHLVTGGFFITVAVIAFVVLGVSLFFDGGLGDGAFSITTLAAFVSLFGFSGFLAMTFGASTVVSVIVGIGVGLLAGLGSMLIMKTLKAGQSSDSISTSEILGQEASVSLVIREGRAGEICFLKHGHMQHYIAYADSAIPQGTEVVIISILSNDSVKVSPSA